jgi:hypothetical protein
VLPGNKAMRGLLLQLGFALGREPAEAGASLVFSCAVQALRQTLHQTLHPKHRALDAHNRHGSAAGLASALTAAWASGLASALAWFCAAVGRDLAGPQQAWSRRSLAVR